MGLAGRYEVVPSGFEETLDDARTPAEVSQELGYGKALWVAERNPGAWVIGSDTIISAEGKQLGKATSEDHAREMLQLMAGATCEITSSAVLLHVTFTPENSRVIKHYIGSDSATIYFKPFNQAALDRYIQTGKWQDKAAAYGIQHDDGLLTEAISGEYGTILGIPTRLLADFLRQIGVRAHPANLTPPVPVKD